MANSLNRGGFFASVLLNLSKAYDCLKDDIQLAKLQAYGFCKKKKKNIFKLSNQLHTKNQNRHNIQ